MVGGELHVLIRVVVGESGRTTLNVQLTVLSQSFTTSSSGSRYKVYTECQTDWQGEAQDNSRMSSCLPLDYCSILVVDL